MLTKTNPNVNDTSGRLKEGGWVVWTQYTCTAASGAGGPAIPTFSTKPHFPNSKVKTDVNRLAMLLPRTAMKQCYECT